MPGLQRNHAGVVWYARENIVASFSRSNRIIAYNTVSDVGELAPPLRESKDIVQFPRPLLGGQSQPPAFDVASTQPDRGHAVSEPMLPPDAMPYSSAVMGSIELESRQDGALRCHLMPTFRITHNAALAHIRLRL